MSPFKCEWGILLSKSFLSIFGCCAWLYLNHGDITDQNLCDQNNPVLIKYFFPGDHARKYTQCIHWSENVYRENFLFQVICSLIFQKVLQLECCYNILTKSMYDRVVRPKTGQSQIPDTTVIWSRITVLLEDEQQFL